MISVLFPTTGRCERARKCLTGLIETAGDWPLEVDLVVDVDKESFKALAHLLECNTKLADWRGVFRPEYLGNVDAWNRALKESMGDYVVFAADDLVFHPGWLDEAMKVMETLPEGGGLVGFNDGHLNGDELSTHYLLSRRFIIDHLGGRVAWPCYLHSFNDLETNERAKRAGRFAWAKDAHVTHDHWTFGTRPQDDTDNRWLGKWGEAHDTYERRKAAGFPDDYPAVIT